jgi:quinoprotein glucose dehydrogenase
MTHTNEMQKQKSGKSVLQIFAAIAVLWFVGCKSPNNNERTWAVYKADANSSSYSPLDQINVSNVSQLQPAWTFTVNDMPKDAQPSSSQCNPIIVDGILYATSAKRLAYAVNAATGEQIWSYDPFDGGVAAE